MICYSFKKQTSHCSITLLSRKKSRKEPGSLRVRAVGPRTFLLTGHSAHVDARFLKVGGIAGVFNSFIFSFHFLIIYTV